MEVEIDVYFVARESIERVNSAQGICIRDKRYEPRVVRIAARLEVLGFRKVGR